MEPEVMYEYEGPEPYLGWNYRVTWGDGKQSASSFGYATKEAAEADARETVALLQFLAGEEGSDAA